MQLHRVLEAYHTPNAETFLEGSGKVAYVRISDLLAKVAPDGGDVCIRRAAE